MASNTNRTNGLRFESDLCQMLSEAGWWAHDMSQNAAGQPADVIAVRCNHAVLIDCKVCSGDSFPLSRVEPNQETAMGLFKEYGNNHAYFALKLESTGVIYMMDHEDLIFLQRNGCKSVPLWYMIKTFPKFEEWLGIMEDEI